MDKKFDLENQYQLYLERVRLKEEDMHPIQRKETKQAFIGACGQILILLRDDLSKLEDNQATEALQDMLNQVHIYFMKATNKTN